MNEYFTDAEWFEFQRIPEQGYSHRAWLNHHFDKVRAPKVVYELTPSALDHNGLFQTVEGAEASALKQLELFLKTYDEQEEYDFPIGTGLTWIDGHDGFGNEVRYATYCKNWWASGRSRSMSSHDRFIIRKRTVSE